MSDAISNPTDGRKGPLAGVKVLDLSSVLMGPFATQILADMGAEVIIVEPLEGGDNRMMGAGNHPEFTGITLNLLRNKSSLAIDLKSPEGRDAVLQVAKGCDVMITNQRPKPLARLGLSYDDVAAINSRIIFCQAVGFPADGPRADDPAYDDIIQTECGMADASVRAGHGPLLSATLIADKVSGMAIVTGVLAALFDRERTGLGQRVDVPMIDVMTSFVLVEHGDGAILSPPVAAAGYSRVLNPDRGPQRTADGLINIMPYTRASFEALFGSEGRQDVLDDPRLSSTRQMRANAPFIYQEMQSVIEKRPTAYWADFCRRHNIPFGLVRTLDEIVADLPIAAHPQAGPYRHIAPPLRFGAGTNRTFTPAPRVGEQSRQVLESAGISSDAIESLLSAGVVRGGDTSVDGEPV